MLSKSPSPVAEEWAIHDYELGPIHISEFESIDTVSRLGRGVVEHGPIFSSWASTLDPDEMEEADELFEENYLGSFKSMEAYATDYLEAMGYDLADLDALGPEELRPYLRFDLNAFASDLASFDRLIEDTDGTVHAFAR